MLRWISSNTVYEVEVDRHADFADRERRATSMKSIQRPDESNDTYQSDSDSDLNVKIVESLFKRGKEKLAEGDFGAAERPFPQLAIQGVGKWIPCFCASHSKIGYHGPSSRNILSIEEVG
jgi:hypothetical protein